MADSPWPLIHAERAALADDLSGLDSAAWQTPSLCARWTVQDVLAHQVSTATLTPLTFLSSLASSGFRFQAFAAKGIDRYGAGSPEATLSAFRAVQTSTSAPPGPKTSWLGEALVHSEDIRRPLGITRDYPLEAVTRTLDFYAGSNALIGTKKRIAGVSLRATDTTWSHGDGPLVEGPAMALLMAATGRTAFLDDLTGPGVEVLRGR